MEDGEESEPNSTVPRLEVKSLWKVFGPGAEAMVASELGATGTKAEIQEQTGAVVAIRDVSFEVYPGEVFVVMGLSGSGKSTLVRCLCRLIEPTAGTVEVDGEDIMAYSDRQLREFRRAKVAMVFQHFGLFPHRRVLDNAAYGLEIKGVDKQTRHAKAREVLEKVGLKEWESHFPNELSGGMQQRVGIARALVLDPEILLMDEPFSGLDPLIRREMQDELIALQSQLQKTIVFITHDLNEALKLGDRIMIMRDGAVIQLGTPEQIVIDPVDEYVREFVQDISKTKVLMARHIMQQPDTVVVEWNGPRVALHMMRTNDIDMVFVTGLGQRLRGLLTLEAAVESANRGVATIRDMSLADCPTATPDTSLDDLIPLAADSDLPVAIVDEEGRLLGEVHRAVLLSAMAGRVEVTA